MPSEQERTIPPDVREQLRETFKALEFCLVGIRPILSNLRLSDSMLLGTLIALEGVLTKQAIAITALRTRVERSFEDDGNDSDS